MTADPSRPTPPSPRVLHLALLGGVLILITVAVILRATTLRDALVPPETGLVLGYASWAVAVLGLVLALALQGRVERRRPDQAPADWWREQMPRLLVVWALAEGVATIGVVTLLVSDQSLAAAAAGGTGLALLAALPPSRYDA